tara:strand:+ start:516 stop:1523 length:1008 start_codon:yes stop_codon:yes gene_type:complete
MIASTYITDYLFDKFGEVGAISSTGKEFVMPSIFVENDWKKHFSINVDTGLWRCFKTGNAGNFVNFFSLVENIPYFRAEAELIYRSFFQDEVDVPVAQNIEDKPIRRNELEEQNLTLVTIDSCTSDNPLEQKAWMFLYERKLFDLENPEETPYYLCTDGKYKDRIIIPFVKNGSTYYFQARSLSERHKPKYLNPSSESGVRPSTIVFPFDESSDTLVVCEGPLDAISLLRQGVNATCTMGCHISDHQMDILRYFKGDIILGYDNDTPGKRGMRDAEILRRRKLMSELFIVPPPEEVNDWNDAHVKGIDLRKYIQKNTKKLNFDYEIDQALNSIPD